MLRRRRAGRAGARRIGVVGTACGERRSHQHHHERGRDSRGRFEPVISHVNRVLVESLPQNLVYSPPNQLGVRLEAAPSWLVAPAETRMGLLGGLDGALAGAAV